MRRRLFVWESVPAGLALRVGRRSETEKRVPLKVEYFGILMHQVSFVHYDGVRMNVPERMAEMTTQDRHMHSSRGPASTMSGTEPPMASCPKPALREGCQFLKSTYQKAMATASIGVRRLREMEWTWTKTSCDSTTTTMNRTSVLGELRSLFAAHRSDI